MTQEMVIIPRSLRSYSATWANRPLTDLMVGDLFYCTDRKVFYRWDGSDWQSQSCYIGAGLYADRPSAAVLPTGSMYFATDNGVNYQVLSGSWITVSSIALKWSGATVFTAAQTLPSSWADLDLSATIGAKQTIVVLQVINSTGTYANKVAFRPNGCPYDFYFADYQAALVILGAFADLGGIAICTTDANGVLELKAPIGVAGFIIKLIGYIN
ncbi:MAG: hypothetical protein JW901_05580 [Dehalococcoidia bacterium]|nr:hypothetical protein [Dehalococcoidia bacterium]